MKITAKPKGPETITMRTTSKKQASQVSKWWLEKDSGKRATGLIDTAAFLKENQNYRFRQAATYARLYGNMSLYSFIGSNMSKLDQQTNTLPIDRPTMNVIQSATDTLVSRISQSRPAPVFLTDNGDYRERNLAKKLNNFILGEFYQAKAYEKSAIILRDSLVEGTGCLKIFETPDNKVGLDRVLLTELLTDPAEGIYSEPRQLYQLKLIDRDVLIDNFPKFKDIIEKAEKATPDNSNDSAKTVSDMVIVVEGWRLPSGKDAGDGRHTIACSAGECFDEEWTKDSFPFVFLHYSQRLLGFWAQGLAEQLMGTQMEINSLLYTISKAIKLVGVPRVFIEKGSKVSKASNNNDVGVIIEYSGVKPSYEVAPCVPEEMYAQLQRLIEYGYQQCGVSSLQATSQKPAGLNSGEAIRSYDDISTDRFAALSRRYDNFFIDLAYQVIDLAKEIAEREGSYATVYPNKNGTKEIDLPKMSLIQDPFVIQCFNQSSLPRDPAGRMQRVTEWMQAGILTIKEARRLMDFQDLEQVEKLANASEERIYQMLDDIIETGKYTPPDPFIDLGLAKDITVQYINLYFAAKLEDAKKEKLISFFNQVNDLVTAATPPPMAGAGQPPNPAQAVPTPPPVSDLLPNTPGAGQ